MLLDEANGRRRAHVPGFDRLDDRRVPIGIRSKIEAHSLFVAVRRLEIGHRIVSSTVSSAAQVAGGTWFSDGKAQQLLALRPLERRTVPGFDARRPLDRLNRRKSIERGLHESAKIFARGRRAIAEG